MECLEWQMPPMPQLVTAGHGIWRPGMMHYRRRFGLYDLIFVKSGCLYMEEDGEQYAVGAGRLLVLEPGKQHEGYRPCEEETELYWVHVKHDSERVKLDSRQIEWTLGLRRGTDQDAEPNQQPVYVPKFGMLPMEETWQTLERIVALHDRLTVDAVWRMHAAFVNLLASLQQSVRGQAADENSRSARLAADTAAYLRRRAFEEIVPGELERELHFHSDYIARCLKKHTGMSPVEYVHRIRLERASRLLEYSPELGVGQIAEAVGFADANYFCRLFRRETGQSPTAFRRHRNHTDEGGPAAETLK